MLHNNRSLKVGSNVDVVSAAQSLLKSPPFSESLSLVQNPAPRFVGHLFIGNIWRKTCQLWSSFKRLELLIWKSWTSLGRRFHLKSAPALTIQDDSSNCAKLVPKKRERERGRERCASSFEWEICLEWQ